MIQTSKPHKVEKEMPEVADDDIDNGFETDFKKTMMTKNFNCMKFSETKQLH